ncbi:MAG TPA: ACT domain-containing protein [Verrucomicrobiales bacterium]|nr:ACT domain-containing protein [Verrucomicrobiales bacterium]
MSSTTLVMTLVGPARTGLVESVASAVAAHQGNWLESRMARLAGQFAGILHVSVPSESAEALAASLRCLEDLTVAVVSSSDRAIPDETTLASAQLELIGQDRPGIVRSLSTALAARGINVEELETECGPAPMSGETLFRARALLTSSDPRALQAIRADLERLGADLMVEIRLNAP